MLFVVKLKRTLQFLLGIAIYLACAIALLLLPLRYARKYFGGGRINSLWAGTPIISMATNARAERALGVNANSLVYSTYFTTSAFDYNLSRWTKIPWLGRLVPLVVFIWACVVADRLHFYCDCGLLPVKGRFTFDFRELRVYKFLNIPVFLWTYGADVRTRKITQGLGEPNCCTDCTQVGSACVCDSNLGDSNYQQALKIVTAIFSMGDMIEYTPGSHNDLFFWPIDLDAANGEKYSPVIPDFDGKRPLRIVHAPNHRMFKGTRFIEKAVKELQENGVAVELLLVEKVPNHVALEIYRSADVIFDQCLVGFHGYFALEGMALGKPVMCFIRKPQQYLLHPEECPLVNIQAATLKQDILRLIEQPEKIAQLGLRGRRYIEGHFSMQAFATRLARAYRDLGVAS